MPANLLQPCPELQELEGPSGGDIIETMLSWAGAYNDCRGGKEALIRAVTS